jgi:F0F1-type ATP synthase membrane subunit b/b'
MTMKNEFWNASGGYNYLIIFLIFICIGGIYGLISSIENNVWFAIFFILLTIVSAVVIVIVLKIAHDRKKLIKRQESDRLRAEEKAKKERAEAEERTRREQAEAEEKAKRDKVEAEKRNRREQSEADAKTRKGQEEWGRTSEAWMKKDVGALIEELGSPNPSNRSHAAFLLGTKKEKRAVNALIDALQDQDSNVVANVIFALGEIGDPHALEPLRKLNDAGIEKLRRIAIEKIRQIKGSE